jgi:DNA-binding HxlR family transcriptional regulator
MLTKDELPACPVATLVEVIGNKWKLLILRNLILLEPVERFSEMKRNTPGISQKVLTENLRALEKDGIIERRVYAEVPPRVEYSLTALGKTLVPVFDEMVIWGENYKSALK